MSLFSLLQKPAWQHRDPDRRAAAVASDGHPELIARLSALARGDAAPQVRLAALRRIDDFAVIAELAGNDPDTGVRALARQRYLKALLDDATPMATREAAIGAEADAEVLAEIAQQANDAPLRRLALSRLEQTSGLKPGLVAERCLRDPDPAIRLWLLERIGEVATLDRIAERARKTDKHLARTARERALAARLAAGDPIATRERTLAICEELDALRRERPADWEDRREQLRSEWKQLASRMDDAMVTRVEGYFAAFDAPPESAPVSPEVVAAEAEPIVDSVPARTLDPVLAALAAELSARAPRLSLRDLEDLERRWLKRQRQVEPLLPEEQEQERHFREQSKMLHRRFEEATQAREAAAAQLPGLAEELAGAVAKGALRQARELETRIEALRKDAGDRMPRALATRISEALAELARLAQWQHWSNNKARARLCEEIEALQGSGLHPDAVAAKVKEAQAQWQQLDEAEQRPGAAPYEHPMQRRFRALCHHALVPAKAYFAKRHELRDARREDFSGAIARIQHQLAQPDTPAAELIAARRNATGLLRRLDELEPSARRDVSRMLRETLAKIDAAIVAIETDAAEAKRKLIARLRRDVLHAEPAAALAAARTAQAEWKTLPRAARETDDALWRELRDLVQPHFSRAEQQRAEAAASESAQRDEARGILAELAELAHDEHAQAIDSRLAALDARWRSLEAQVRPVRREDAAAAARGRRPLAAASQPIADARAYAKAVAAVRERETRRRNAQRAAELVAILEAARLLDQLECLGADASDDKRMGLRERLDQLTLLPDARTALAPRLAVALRPEGELPLDAASADTGDSLAEAEELVVLAELATDLDSPPEARELRRRIQIQRLSERLTGGAESAGNEEIRPLLLRYLGLRGVPAHARPTLTERLARSVARRTSGPRN